MLGVASGEATAALLLPIPRYERHRPFSFYGVCRKIKEPTSGLEPLTCSLRVCGQWLLSVARVCKSRISKRSPIPSIARCCRVLRPG